jgi:hypothetical protein
MPDKSKFDPRLAALNYAAQTEGGDAHAINAIACGLVYIGDQLAAANERAEERGVQTNGYLSAVVNLLETLDASVTNGLAAIADEL